MRRIIEQSEDRVEFRNWIAIWFWGFTAAWLGMLCVMTVLLATIGVPSNVSSVVMFGLLGVFWMAGVALLVHCLHKACVTVFVDGGNQISVTWRYPLRVKRIVVPRSSIAPAEVGESVDDDNDPYFKAQWRMPDGQMVVLAESNGRDSCDRTCERFNRALESRVSNTSQPVE